MAFDACMMRAVLSEYSREFPEAKIEKVLQPRNDEINLLKPDFTVEELVEPIEFLDSIRALIVSDSLSFETAAAEHSHDIYSKKNGGIVTNHDILTKYPALSNVKFSATKFKKDDFGSQGGKSLSDYYALSKLKVGEVSTAFQSEDVNGNEVARILKLVEVIPTHSASLVDDYLTIEKKALEKDIRHLYGRITGKVLKENIVRRVDGIDPGIV